jgi:hypothetical protein
MPKLTTTAQPRTYSATYVRGLEDLLVKANASYARLYDRWKAADAELRTMKAKRSPLQAMQAYAAEHAAPLAPNVLQAAVEEQKKRGLR